MSGHAFMHDDAAWILRHGGGEISEIKAGWRNVSRAVFFQPVGSGEVVELRYVGKSCEIGGRGCKPIMLQPVGYAENVFKLQVTANCQLVFLLLSDLLGLILELPGLGNACVAVVFIALC